MEMKIKSILAAGIAGVGAVAAAITVAEKYFYHKDMRDRASAILEEEIKKYDWGDYRVFIARSAFDTGNGIDNIFESLVTNFNEDFFGFTRITENAEKRVTFFAGAFSAEEVNEIMDIYGYEPSLWEQFVRDIVAHEWRHTRQFDYIISKVGIDNIGQWFDENMNCFDYMDAPTEQDAIRYQKTREDVPFEEVFSI